jgi:hypothetical protein
MSKFELNGKISEITFHTLSWSKDKHFHIKVASTFNVEEHLGKLLIQEFSKFPYASLQFKDILGKDFTAVITMQDPPAEPKTNREILEKSGIK